MNDVVDELGRPVQISETREETVARIREFQSLPPDERGRIILEMMASGLEKIRNSPRREEIYRRWEEEHEEFKRFMRELVQKHGALPDPPVAG